MKFKYIALLILISLSLIYAKPKGKSKPTVKPNQKSDQKEQKPSPQKPKEQGLKLGIEYEFDDIGEFTIVVSEKGNTIQVDLPDMSVDKFVIYRNTEKGGNYRKVGILSKGNVFIDKNVSKGVEYFYVAVAVIKEKNNWIKKNSNKAKSKIKMEEEPKDEEIISEVEVNFMSTPSGGIVVLNNENIGNTPITKKYKVGMYELTIQKAGYKTYKNFIFNVDYKKKIDVNVTLEKIRSGINITTVPSDAQIKINNKPEGKSPLKKDNLDLANYIIEASLQGYHPSSKAVILDSETPVSLNLILQEVPHTGDANIDSTPKSAEVFIDNIKKGRTPVLIKDIEAGIHSLILKKADYNDITADIVIETNQKKDFNFTMAKQYGFLNIKTFPDEAECFINDKLIGTTLIKGYKLDKGSYNLVIKKENYSDYKELVNIKVNQQIERDIILSLLKSTLVITTVPDKAKVSIFGKDYGYTPFISDKMQPGKIKVVLSKKDFEQVTEEIMLDPGDTEELSYTLKPVVIVPVAAPVPKPEPEKPVPKPEPKPVLKPTVPPVQPQVQTPQPSPPPPPVVIKNGTLSVITSPAGAAVFVNNQKRGQSPLILSLKPGEYSVLVELNQYQDEPVRKASIEPGDKEDIRINLKPLEAVLNVNSTPPGANVYLNSKSIGKTPLKYTVKAGNYVLSVKKEKYQPASTTLRITGLQKELTKKFTLKEIILKDYFNSNPRGVEVILNGKIIGITPFETLKIQDGTHDIIFRKTGYRLKTKRSSFVKQTSEKISVTLEGLKGDLMVSSDPAGCDIFEDKKKLGVTGKLIRNIPAGYHRIRVSKYGYYDVDTSVRIDDRKQTTRNVKLNIKPRGNLHVDSSPQNGKVYIAGQFKGVTPILLEGLPEGKYQVRIKADKHKSFKTSVYIPGNRTEYINAKLVPGSDCFCVGCLGSALLTKPAFWYVLSALSLGGSGWSWYEEKQSRENGKRKLTRDYRRSKDGLAVAGGACALIGIGLSIAH